MHHLGAHKQLFGFLFGNLTGTLGFLLGAQALVLLQLTQFVGQRIGLAFHLLGQRTGFGAGRFQLVFALPDQFIPLFLGSLQLVGCLVLQLFHLVLAFLQLQFQIIQLTQNGIQPLILGRQMLLRCLNDPLRDAKLLTDEECVGLARHADAQLIGRAQRFQIEFAAGVHNALGLQCEHLELCIVGGGHQQHAAAAQFFNDGHSQRGTLGRVGTGTQLVQQHKSVRHGQLQNAGDLFHMAGEGGKALFDALLIADVHEKLIEHADLAALVGRDQETTLCHRAQQTGRFQGDGLAAGVRAGDDERIIFFAQCNVHRHALLWVDQWVACPDQREGIVGAHCRFECLELQRQTRLCQQDINVQHGLIAVLELRLNGCHLCGKGYQNALDLLRFLGTILQDAGIGFHDSLRFHKHRCTGRGNVMDDAAHFAAVFALDRDNVSAVAHGDHTLLQIF